MVNGSPDRCECQIMFYEFVMRTCPDYGRFVTNSNTRYPTGAAYLIAALWGNAGAAEAIANNFSYLPTRYAPSCLIGANRISSVWNQQTAPRCSREIRSAELPTTASCPRAHA